MTLELARRGYVAAAVGYRLAPQHPFPAPLDDARAAVRWLQANADRYSIDPGRIGAVGYSAGGTLACLLGSAPDHDSDRAGPPASDRVQAVVCFYGVTDLADLYDQKVRRGSYLERLGTRGVLEALLGGPPEAHPDGYAAASPITRADPDSPPTLLLHGAADGIVPVDQSRRYARRLREAGARVELLVLEGVGHNFGGGTGGLAGAAADAAAIAFLDRKLKRPGPVARRLADTEVALAAGGGR
jgi:acetyl esterase/lipase